MALIPWLLAACLLIVVAAAGRAAAVPAGDEDATGDKETHLHIASLHSQHHH